MLNDADRRLLAECRAKRDRGTLYYPGVKLLALVERLEAADRLDLRSRLTASELQSVQRLQRHAAGEGCDDIYPNSESSHLDLYNDKFVLADALLRLLAEEPNHAD